MVHTLEVSSNKGQFILKFILGLGPVLDLILSGVLSPEAFSDESKDWVFLTFFYVRTIKFGDSRPH